MKYYSFVLLLLGLLILSSSAFGQALVIRSSQIDKGTITGVVVDSSGKSPIEFANFKLVSLKDTARTLNTVTQKNGRFILNNIPFDSYSAEVSSVGYKKRRRRLIILNEKVRTIDLDTIKLPQKNILLNEVNVSERQEETIREKEKIVIPVRRELGDDALEILENIPMINVDVDGKISIPGKQNTAVYIDGVPLNMAGYSSTEELRTLSFFEIQKVEVIENPSIEYSEAMDGGVINIVTRKKIDNKFFGVTNVGGDTKDKLSSSIALSYNNKIVSPKISYSFNNPKSNSRTYLNKTTSINDQNQTLEQINESQSNLFSNSGMLTLSLNPGEKDILMTTLSYRNNFTRRTKSFINNTTTNGGQLFNSSLSKNGIQQEFIIGSGFYRKTFKEPGHSLMLMCSVYDNSMVNTTNINYARNDQKSLGASQYNLSQNTNNRFSVAVNYNYPLTKESKLSSRYSIDNARVNMSNNYYDYSQTLESFVENMTNKDNYFTKTTNQYLSCSFNTIVLNNDLNFNLAVENYKYSYENTVSNKDFSDALLTLSPSISLRRDINKEQSVNLSFNRKYSSPMNRNINPHTDYSDSTNIFVGNPDLEPICYNNINTGYNYSNAGNGFSLTFGYSYTNNFIELVTTQKTLSTSVTMYDNVASLKSLSASLSGYGRLFDFISLTAWTIIRQTEYKGNHIDNRGVSWYSMLNSSFSFGDFRFQMFFSYSSPEVSVQGETRSNYSMDIAVKKLFFDRSLSITLKVSDLFNSRRNNINSSGTSFYLRSGTSEVTRVLSLNLNYFFQSIANQEIGPEGDGSEYADDF